MASFGLASVLGVPFGLFIATKFSWHAPFLLLGILAFIIDVMIISFMPKMRGHLKEVHTGPWEVLTRIFGRPNARLGLTFTSMLMLGHFTIIPFIAPYMVGNVGFTEGQLALIYLVGGMCTMFTSPWVGKMADKHGRLKIFTIFGSLVIIPILLITNLQPVPVWTVLLISAIFFIFSNGRMVPSTTMETAIIRPENRGSYMSIRSSVQQLTSGLASFVAGLIIVERPPIFGEVKSLANFNLVGGIAVFFSLVALYVARRITVEQGS
jgi:predicted MFS family arabinose efflux permease